MIEPREPVQPISAEVAPQNAVLDAFLRQAADAAEQTASRIRIILLLLVQLRLVLVAGPLMLQGSFNHWFATGVIVLGIAVSLVHVRAVRRAERKQALLIASTMIDAVVAFLIILPSVLWPRDAYVGTLAGPDFGIWPIVVAAAGLRLSSRAALAGAGTALASVVVLVAADFQLNADRLAYGAPEVLLAIVLIAGATLFALGVDARIRRLVAQGAEQAVGADRALQRLGAYVSEEIAAHVLRQPDAMPGGVHRQAAVLFSDLRAFTRTGERIGPDALVTELNAYLEAMVPAIRANGGVVDKYMGDAILAVFGVPESRGNEASRAMRAAEEMQLALQRHNEVRIARGMTPLAHGIGVHYGPVVAGHVGTRERLQYTVIGDTVNVASRLQTATKDVGVPTLFSRALVDRATAEGPAIPPTRPLPSLELRGRTEQIEVCTLV